MPVTGATRIYYIVGDPIAQVKSPQVLNEMFAARGIDAVMLAYHVAAGDLEAAWRAFRAQRNLGGFIVTVPHKPAACALSDEVGEMAGEVGTANAVRRLADGRMRCDNFDGYGFLAALEADCGAPADRRALLVGAGGVGACIGYTLARHGVRSLTVCDTDAGRAQRLAGGVLDAYPACDVAVGEADPRGHDLIVNATPLGMRADDPLPLDVSRLEAAMQVFDVIMEPEPTALTLAARAAGCRAGSGRRMLAEAAPVLFDFLVQGQDPVG